MASSTGPGERKSMVKPERWSGSSTAVSSSATTRRTRAGTLSSPRPGSSITMAPIRANISR